MNNRHLSMEFDLFEIVRPERHKKLREFLKKQAQIIE